MFTGLVEQTGIVDSVQKDDGGAVLEIVTPLAAELKEGDSISVNGACLTATALSAARFKADVMPESLKRTTLGELDPGEPVNLELPVAVGDRLDGHIVQGHVDGVGTVLAITQYGGFARIVRVRPPAELAKYIVEKGSIAIDGVSLTVSDLGDDWFEVSLIPETIEGTTLGILKMDMHVNLEVDVLAKHVERLIQYPQQDSPQNPE